MKMAIVLMAIVKVVTNDDYKDGDDDGNDYSDDGGDGDKNYDGGNDYAFLW